MSAICHECEAPFEANPVTVKRRGWLCPQCLRDKDFAYRQKRRAAGIASTNGRPSPEYARAWSAKPENRLKNATRARTRYAIKHGKLVPLPCEVCGNEPVEAHHDDYSDHMKVRWFCKEHHEIHHRQARGGA